MFIGRSFGWGGFPGTGGAQEGVRDGTTYRVSTGLDGTMENGVNWDLDLSYSEAETSNLTNDTYILGFTAALNGFGVCTDPSTGNDPATGTQPFAPGYAGGLVAESFDLDAAAIDERGFTHEETSSHRRSVPPKGRP